MTKFIASNNADEFQKILNGKFSFLPEDYWADISDAGVLHIINYKLIIIQHLKNLFLAKSFIKSLIVVDPEKRLTAEEALKHEWMSYAPIVMEDGSFLSSRGNTVDLLPSVKKQFVSFFCYIYINLV
jgi:calcium/calmodulin-dependent protein kinase I